MDYWVYAWAKPIGGGLLAGSMILQALMILVLVLAYCSLYGGDGVE